MSFEELRLKLPDYLESRGIDPRKKFLCIHPEHPEKTPSSHLYKNKHIKCFGCGKTADIFEAASILEGLPRKNSPNYFRDNIQVLAKRFGVILPNSYSSSVVEIYNMIYHYITEDYASRIASEKGISKEEVITAWAPKKFQQLQKETPPVLETPSYTHLMEYLSSKGFSSFEINEAGVVPYLFSKAEGAVLFPLWFNKDVIGGFMRRMPDGYKPKYLNTPNNPMYIKSEYIYGMQYSFDSEKDLVIVEGQKDVLALRLQGVQAVALSGNSLSVHHLKQILGIPCRNIILALDNDVDPDNPILLIKGKKRMHEAIESFIKKGMIPKVYIWQTKDANEDHDNEIPFQESEIKDGLEWYLDHIDLTSQDELRKLTYLLSEIEGNLLRLSIMQQVADLISVDFKYLKSDVEDVIRSKQDNVNTKVVNLFKNAYEEVIKTPDQAAEIMGKASKLIETFTVKTNNIYHNNELNGLFKKMAKTESFCREDFVMSSRGLGELMNWIGDNSVGWSKTGSFNLIPGVSHAGKTLLLMQHMSEVLVNNTNAQVFLLSTDDSLEMILPRLIAATIYNPEYEIGYIANPSKIPEYLIHTFKNTMGFLQKCIEQERLVMKDSSSIRSAREMFDIIKFYRDKYPDRQAILYNDNFHRNSDYMDKGEILKVELSAADMKDFVTTEKMSAWCSAEKRKVQNNWIEPFDISVSNEDIKGAGALVYYATIIMFTVNDYIQRGKDISKCCWVHTTNSKRLEPQTQIKVTKNKTNGRTGNWVFNQFPYSNILMPTDSNRAYEEARQRAKDFGYFDKKGFQK